MWAGAVCTRVVLCALVSVGCRVSLSVLCVRARVFTPLDADAWACVCVATVVMIREQGLSEWAACYSEGERALNIAGAQTLGPAHRTVSAVGSGRPYLTRLPRCIPLGSRGDTAVTKATNASGAALPSSQPSACPRAASSLGQFWARESGETVLYIPGKLCPCLLSPTVGAGCSPNVVPLTSCGSQEDELVREWTRAAVGSEAGR